MSERTDDEDIRPEGPEPETAAPGEPAPAEPAPAADLAADAGKAAEPSAPPARRGISALLSSLALLVALLAAAGVAWLAWSGRGEGDVAVSNREAIAAASTDLAETRSAMDELRARIGALDRASGEQAGRLDELNEKLSELNERLDPVPERLASLESAVSSLAGISTGARETWLLAEAEHYMQIANAQLQLAGNPERALHALRFAEERIRQLADPALTEVRRALADETRALQAMETPDLAGVTLTLASLADNVASLPLQQDAEPETGTVEPPAGQSGFARAVASVKSAFSDIISVRRTDENVEPLLSPEAEYFLRANLALRLQMARLALLRGEQAVVEQTLEDAARWLHEYYAPDSRAVQSALATLAEIREADWSVTPPDISTSLRLLREYRERRQAEAPEPGAGEEPAADEPVQ